MKNTKIPNKLYHYCSLAAFISIIQNKCIWLSDTKHTNDLQETKLVDVAIEKYLSKTVEECSGDKICRKDLINYYNAFKTESYIGCFSKKRDLLSQWRAYADDGRGVAVNINLKKLDVKNELPYLTDNNKMCFLQKVIYLKSVDINDDNINNIFSILSERIDTKKLTDKDLLKIIDELRPYRYFCKNRAFSEEEEWRIIYNPLVNRYNFEGDMFDKELYKNIKFRSVGNKIISYFEFPLENDCINEIILGPKYCGDIETIKLLLESQNLKNIKISKSKIPYY